MSQSTNQASASNAVPDSPSVVGISGLSSQNATTDFVDDAMVTKRDETANASRDELLNVINDSQLTTQTMLDFLAKPIVLANGSFSTADTYSFLNSYSMPYAALTSASGAMYLNKLRGYYGMQCDMRFRLVINANRFQQGRYCIGWVPLCSPGHTTSGLKNLLFNNMHMASLVQRTTVPHVEIDLATGTSAELLIPYTSPANFYSLTEPLSGNDEHPLGFVNVYPYSPLVSPAGSTVASYTLYVSFENVRLFGAASPQSGLSDREVSNRANGPVTSATMAMSRGFKEFSQIPYLSSYAKSISWVLERVSKTASIFGFSKPLQGDSLTKMNLLNAPSHSTMDGDSDARAISLLSKPGTVQVDGLFGTHYDEMDFSYIVRKSAWFQTGSWNTSQTVGNLYSIPVRPSIGIYGVGGAAHFTPLTFVTDMFQDWRGSLVFTFKLVKTEFHSGRLSFAFYPTDAISTYTADPYYVNRVIVDIRDTTEVVLTVPYISRTPWQYVGDHTGYLSIDIVDPLVAPATVSSSIIILTEVAGGDDFEVAIPGRFDYNITTIVPQSGLVETAIVRKTIGSSSVDASPVVATATCIGDKTSNFRAYLKRFTKTAYSGTPAATHILNGRNIRFPSDFIMATSGTPPATFWNTDTFGLVASCYGMVKGGIRFRDIIDMGMLSASSTDTTTSGIYKAPAIAYHCPDALGLLDQPLTTGNGSPSSITLALSSVVQTPGDNNALTIELPQYTTALARSTVDMFSFQTGSTVYGYNNSAQATTTRGYLTVSLPAHYNSLLNTSGDTDGYSLHNLYRSASEDTSFGAFISVPPLVVSTPVNVTGFF